jgi:hypothetical protein
MCPRPLSRCVCLRVSVTQLDPESTSRHEYHMSIIWSAYIMAYPPQIHQHRVFHPAPAPRASRDEVQPDIQQHSGLDQESSLEPAPLALWALSCGPQLRQRQSPKVIRPLAHLSSIFSSAHPHVILCVHLRLDRGMASRDGLRRATLRRLADPLPVRSPCNIQGAGSARCNALGQSHHPMTITTATPEQRNPSHLGPHRLASSIPVLPTKFAASTEYNGWQQLQCLSSQSSPANVKGQNAVYFFTTADILS